MFIRKKSIKSNPHLHDSRLSVHDSVKNFILRFDFRTRSSRFKMQINHQVEFSAFRFAWKIQKDRKWPKHARKWIWWRRSGQNAYFTAFNKVRFKKILLKKIFFLLKIVEEKISNRPALKIEKTAAKSARQSCAAKHHCPSIKLVPDDK